MWSGSLRGGNRSGNSHARVLFVWKILRLLILKFLPKSGDPPASESAFLKRVQPKAFLYFSVHFIPLFWGCQDLVVNTVDAHISFPSPHLSVQASLTSSHLSRLQGSGNVNASSTPQPCLPTTPPHSSPGQCPVGGR